jgi:hypothetical protein
MISFFGGQGESERKGKINPGLEPEATGLFMMPNHYDGSVLISVRVAAN